jgi:large subunit ribosomal protein L31
LCGAWQKRSGGGTKYDKASIMKPEIHPNYSEVTVSCSCGNSFKTCSTLTKDFHIDVCGECHPFYTGKQKMVDTGGRIDRFTKRFATRIGGKK